MILTATIVTYNNDIEILKTVFASFLNTSLDVKLYVVDNSMSDLIKHLCKTTSGNIEYIRTERNFGFGAGHNVVLNDPEKLGKYHLILNPDIQFCENTIDELLLKMESDNQIGIIMPKVLNVDGTVQYLPKLLPTPFNLIIRVIPVLSKIFNSVNRKYTLYDYSNLEMNVPIISGCFSFFRVEVLKEVGLYDEKYFMYFEDFDISRRVHSKYKTVYFPKVSITHVHERGAAKNFKLFKVFLKSAFIYFNKYGWFFDPERRRTNKNVINQLNKE